MVTAEDDRSRVRRLDMDPRVLAELRDVRGRIQGALARLVMLEERVTTQVEDNEKGREQ